MDASGPSVLDAPYAPDTVLPIDIHELQGSKLLQVQDEDARAAFLQ